MEYQDEMCEKLIKLSFAKIVSSKNERGACLRKNLLILQLLQKARLEQQKMRQWKEARERSPAECFDDQREFVERYTVLDINESMLQWQSHTDNYICQEQSYLLREEPEETKDKMSGGQQNDTYFHSYYGNNEAENVGNYTCIGGDVQTTDWQCMCSEEKIGKRKPSCDDEEDSELLPGQKRLRPPLPADDDGSSAANESRIDQSFAFFQNSSRTESLDGSGHDFGQPSFVELICES